MDIKAKLDRILDQWNLLNHPFYQAWSAGTLSLDALRIYAREYRELIAALPMGWETLQDEETASEEREHILLWDDFREALGEGDLRASIKEAKELTRAAHELFSTPAAALGALYAFEAQQPATAKSKLDGLKTHYQLPKETEPYFEVHSSNWHESRKLLDQISALSPSEQDEAYRGCERMAASLWNALTGIQQAAC